MTTKIKRSSFKTFLNTRTAWSLIGDGVSTAKIVMKPKTTEEQYIIEDSARTSIDSYAPSLPVEMTCKVGDAAFTYLDSLRYARAIGYSAETEICNVWAYETPSNGYYPAERQNVVIAIEDFGEAGGISVKMNYTLAFVGDPVAGFFNPTTGVFIVGAGLAVLTTLVMGSGTLSPLFSVSHYWLWYSTTIAAATVTMTSTCTEGGAVVVQKDTNGNVVGQGGAAALALGLNHLTITVTHDSETVVYHIEATRTV